MIQLFLVHYQGEWTVEGEICPQVFGGLAGQYNTGTRQYLGYHYDNIGSTTMVTDMAGRIVEKFAYGTYGKLLTAVKNRIRFLYNGSYGVTTDENGLYYMHARYYNSDIKRFINQDIKVGDIGNGQGLSLTEQISSIRHCMQQRVTGKMRHFQQ